MRPSPTMADIPRPGLTSLLPFVVLLYHLVCFLNAAHGHALDFPTAGMSTGWSSTPTTEHAVKFPYPWEVRSPLLRRSREGSGPSYACGFYSLSIFGSYSYFYFAIVIIQVNSSGDVSLSSIPQVVWVANRNHPVAENAILQLGSDGDLVLTTAKGTKVWSTNTSGKSVTGMNLTEYGNLVLFGDGGNDDIVWDSFDHPTDSLVPGQKLRIGQNLTAGYEGNIYLSATPSGLMAFSGTEPPTRYACILTTDNTGKIEYFEFMNGSISTTSSGQHMPPSQFFRLENDGSLAVYKWNFTLGYEGWDVINAIAELRGTYCWVSFFPTAGISTRWMSTPKMEDILRFTDGSQVRSHLVRRREDAGPTYSCGFYCKGPCDSFLFAIIIISVDGSGNIPLSAEPQVVWVANRGRPVGGNATLRLGSDGDLVLMDSDGAKVWSTDTSGKSVTGMNLTERGNLVLFGGNYKNGTTVWESFDRPTDTMVPGQKLHVRQRLTASDSATNSTAGLYYLYADSTGLSLFIKSEPPLRYSFLSLGRTDEKIDSFEFKNGSISTSSSEESMPPTQFLRLESDGHPRVYEWSPTKAAWTQKNDLLNLDPSLDACFHPMVCGRYGICSENEVCRCPQWDDSINYFAPVDMQDLRLGCKEVTPLSCQSPHNHRLRRLDRITCFFRDRQPPDISGIDEGGCRIACEKNCSCRGAFFSPVGRCYLAHEAFSLKASNDSNSIAFIKVQIGPSQTPPGPSKSTPKAAIIMGSTFGALFLLILVVVRLILIGRREMLDGRVEAPAEHEEGELERVSGMPMRFSFEELSAMTDGFCKKLGQGGFGSVYEGRMAARTIAVKRLDSAGQGGKEFHAEVQTIGKIHHVNLVKLMGYCAEKSCKLLVYEFMPNGSLDKWIFSRDERASLAWQTRCKIILGVAKGLSYLHEECSQRIAHLDIKPQNILLDDKFNAKISDFGLAKLFDRDQTHFETRMRGTPGYLAPEWLSSRITEKVDVYSFGVVVLEIVCGRRNLDRSRPEEDVVLISLLKKKKAKTDELLDLVDECIKSASDLHVEEVMKMMKVAMWCLQDQNNRPSMSTVVKILEGAIDIESNMEDMFWTSSSAVERNGSADAGSSAPMLASVLSGPR